MVLSCSFSGCFAQSCNDKCKKKNRFHRQFTDFMDPIAWHLATIPIIPIINLAKIMSHYGILISFSFPVIYFIAATDSQRRTHNSYFASYWCMLTSSNGNNVRITGLLCGEFTRHRWIPRTKASDAELWCFLWSAPETTVEHTQETPLNGDAMALHLTSL